MVCVYQTLHTMCSFAMHVHVHTNSRCPSRIPLHESSSTLWAWYTCIPCDTVRGYVCETSRNPVTTGDHWRPIGDLLATNWQPGDLATWRPTGDLLATTGDYWQRGTMLMHWRPLATAGHHWRRGDLATIGDYWRPGYLATAGDRWRPLATAGDLCDPQQLRPLWGV